LSKKNNQIIVPQFHQKIKHTQSLKLQNRVNIEAIFNNATMRKSEMKHFEAKDIEVEEEDPLSATVVIFTFMP
jgi:hypothetical protein